jgi:hypothetical protein
VKAQAAILKAERGSAEVRVVSGDCIVRPLALRRSVRGPDPGHARRTRG